MENHDPKTSKATGRASAALTDLIRLIAHQAAREWVEQQPDRKSPRKILELKETQS